MQIFPSLISGDLLHLADCISMLEPHCDGFHLDVMDFRFVPNLTWGPMFVNAIRAHAKKQLWIDLLVENPERYLDQLQLAPGDIVSIHYESHHAPDAFKQIKAHGWQASVALDPTADPAVLLPLLPKIDHILIMSVIPGFSGQPFIPTVLEKLKTIHRLCLQEKKQLPIGMDGGINAKTLPAIVSEGIDMIAAASALFSATDPVEELKKLYAIASKTALKNG